MSTINEQMTLLADAIRSKSGATGKLSITAMTSAVNSIEINTGSDIDFTGVNVTADALKEGIIAVDSSGVKITGTAPVVALTQDGNTVAIARGFTEGGSITITPEEPETPTAATVTVSKNIVTITPGVIDEQTIEIPKVTPSLTGNVFTVGEGYTEATTLTVPKSEVVYDSNKVTVGVGYVEQALEINKYESSGCTHPTAEVTVNKNIVTITSGLIYQTQTVEIPQGSVSREGIYIKVKEGYVETAEIALPVVEPSLSGNVFTVGEGWVEEAYTLTVPEASITETETEITVGVGYISTQKVFEKSSTPELPSVTVTAKALRDGVTALDSNGNVVTGTMENVSIFQDGQTIGVREGYIEATEINLELSKITETTENVTIGVGYVNEEKVIEFPATELPDVTFTAADLLVDKTAIDSDGNVVTGTMPYAEPVGVDSGSYVVKYTAGYLPEGIEETAPTAEVVETDEQVTIGMGWVGAPITVNKGGGASDSVISLVKVENFVPPHDAFSAIESFTVSGFGTHTLWDDETVDYSKYNGTYNVVAETVNANSTKKRVFKHETEEMYLFRYYDTEGGYGWCWFFNDTYSSASTYNCLAFYNSDDLPPITTSWYLQEEAGQVTLDVVRSEKQYPAQDLVLQVTPAESYSIENDVRVWSFGGVQEASDYEVTPVVGAMHVLLSDGTLSSLVYESVKQGVNGLVFIADMTSPNAEIGAFTSSGSVTYSSNGALLASVYLTTSILVEDFSGDFTFIAEITLPNTSRIAIFAGYDSDYMIGIDTNGKTYNMWAGNSGWNILEADSGYSDDEYSGSGRGSIQVTPNVSQKIVFTRTGDKWELYVDGVLSVRRYREGTIETGGYIAINRWGTGGYHSTGMVIKNVKMYKRGLKQEDL